MILGCLSSLSVSARQLFIWFPYITTNFSKLLLLETKDVRATITNYTEGGRMQEGNFAKAKILSLGACQLIRELIIQTDRFCS